MESELTRPIAVLWWTMCVAWAGLVFYLSTEAFGPNLSRALLAWAFDLLRLPVSWHTFRLLHDSLRGAAHVIEYAIFALFLYGLPVETSRGLWRPRRALFCIVFAAAYALSDEFHQLFVPGRHASLFDCGLDASGAALAMLLPYTQGWMARLKANHAHCNSYCDVEDEIASRTKG